MTAPVSLLTDDEVRRCVIQGEEAGFGCLSSSLGRLPLKAMDVSAKIIATFAQTTMRQTFVNTLGQPLEATYIFPLPDRAAVTRFVMEVAGRKVEGEIQERRQARQTYDRAIATGQRASIAEEERPGVFTIRVGNLMPGEAATIMLELTGPLPIADGEVTYRFPLVVAQRYIPGHALGGDNVGDGTAQDTNAVPDASRISPPVLLPGFPNPVRLAMSVELDAAGLPLSHVRSSLHAAYASDRGGALSVQLGAGERLDRDFILRFRLGDAQARSSLRVLQGEQGEDTFMLTLVPPSTITRKPKDVVFVLDKSGSMGGWKMVAARRAVARMVDTLGPEDRFHVIAFASGMESCPHLPSGLADATDRNRFRAVEWLSSINAGGGTEMAAPLGTAAGLLTYGYLERDRALVFVTDGQVGNESQLVKMLGDQLRGTRVFAVGIDTAVNEAFLNRLAALGRSGHAELIESEERLDESLQRLHRRVDAPAVSELALDVLGGALVRDSIAPSRIPDLFPGVPVTVFGRLPHNHGAPQIQVLGRTADGREYLERVSGEQTANRAVLAAWARAHLRDLEDRFDIGKESKQELERRIVDVSLRARVLCRFTAFVAVDHEVVNRGGWQQHVTQAVEATNKSSMATPSRRVMPPSAPAPASYEQTRSAPMPTGAAMRARAEAAPAPAARVADMDSMDMLSDDEGSGSFAGLSEDAGAPPARSAAPSYRASGSGASPPPAAPKPAPGMIPPGEPLLEKAKSVLGGLFGSKKEHKADGGAPQSLRDRLTQLLELLRRRGEVFATARETIEKLQQLVEEMAFSGAPVGERQPAEELLRELRMGVDASDLVRTDATLRKLERYCEDRVGGGSAPASASTGGRGDFWR
jgi:Ca-activated chloride channel homolog